MRFGELALDSSADGTAPISTLRIDEHTESPADNFKHPLADALDELGDDGLHVGLCRAALESLDQKRSEGLQQALGVLLHRRQPSEEAE